MIPPPQPAPHPVAQAAVGRAKLAEAHLLYLQDRGISAETAEAHYWSDGEDLIIPFRDPSGQTYLIRSEEKKQDGQPYLVRRPFPSQQPKFRSPRAAGNRPYFSPLMPQGALARTDWAAVFVEGPIKADALYSHIPEGYVFIGLNGTWNWKDKRDQDGIWRANKEETSVLPELKEIPLAGRQVITMFDSDINHNSSVYGAAKMLRVYAQQRGARIFDVALPSEPDGSKNGPDDYLVRHGTAALLELLENPEVSGWPLSPPLLSKEGELRSDYSPSEQKQLLLELGQISDIAIRDSMIRALAARLRWKYTDMLLAIEESAEGGFDDEEFFVSLSAFDDDETLDSRWILPGVLPKSEVIVLTADPGTGKSLLAYDLCYAMATGGSFLGFPIQKGKVLIVQLEEGPSSYKLRLKAKGFVKLGETGSGSSWSFTKVFDLANRRHVQILKSELNQANLVMFDSARAVGRSFDIDENHADFGKRIIRPIAKLFHNSNASGIIIHHNASSTGKASGTPDITAAVWGVFNMKRAPGATNNEDSTYNDFHLISDKVRDGDPIKWHLRRNRTKGADNSGNGWEHELVSELQYNAPDAKIRDQVFSALKGAAGPISLRDIATANGLPDDSAGKVNASLRSAASRDPGIRRWQAPGRGPQGEFLYEIPAGFEGAAAPVKADQGTETDPPPKKDNHATLQSPSTFSGLHKLQDGEAYNPSGLHSTEKMGGGVCVPPEAEPAEPLPNSSQPLKPKALLTAAPLLEPEEGPLPADDLIVQGSTDPLVIDLETSSSRDLWAAPSDSKPFIRLIGSDQGNNIDVSGLLEHAGPLVAHNGFGFDFIALAHHHGLELLEFSEQGRLIDTMVLALALTPPADGAMKGGQLWRHLSLHNCAERAGIKGKADDLGRLAIAAAGAAGHTGSPTDLKELGYGLIPQGNKEYNAYLRGDVAATRGLFDALVPSGVLDAYSQREMRIMGRLTAGITVVGTRVDVELTRQRYEEIEAQKEAYRQSLIQDYGLPTTTATGKPAANPLSCKGADEAITAAAKDLRLKLPRTPNGKASTSKEKLGPLLERCRARGNPQQVTFLETILGLSGARTVYGTTLDCLQVDGRIHPTVSPIQASGRFSITKPGITVFGKRGDRLTEREVFLPDNDDHVFIAADLSQIDMRAIAAHAQDPAYLELFMPGRDAHSEVAKAVNMSRTDAKAIGHGWNYGMSVNGMVNRGIERALAQRFDVGMRRSFPILCRWKDRVRRQAEVGEKLDNGFGRLMKADPRRAHTQAPALMGQGTARDLMMEAVLRLPLWLVPQLRFLVHDELVFSVPSDRLEEAGQQILDAMTFEWKPPGAVLAVLISADLSKPGRNWAECYAKVD